MDPESPPNKLADLTPRAGTVLQGRYRIVSELASGGMGVVFRGERVDLGRAVAIKFVRAPFAANPDAVKRFEREALAMSRLTHPNCVSVFDIGLHAEMPYLVMDFVSGQNLKQVIEAEGPIAPGRSIHIVRQILSAVSHAHSHGMVHRDIKPANIMLSDAAGTADHVMVLDFGLAAFYRDAFGEKLTASNIVLGTPSYMSPEQSRTSDVGPASDIYAIGVLLFELVTGEKPYPGKEPLEIVRAHRKAPIPSARERLAGRSGRTPGTPAELSADFDEILRMALAKEPEQRFATAVAFAEALAELPEAASYSPRIATGQEARLATPLPVSAPAASAHTEALGTVDLMAVSQSALVRPEAAPAPPVVRHDTTHDGSADTLSGQDSHVDTAPDQPARADTAPDQAVHGPTLVTQAPRWSNAPAPARRSRPGLLIAIGVALALAVLVLVVALAGDDGAAGAGDTADAGALEDGRNAVRDDAGAIDGGAERAAPDIEVKRVADVEALFDQGRTAEAVAGIETLLGRETHAKNGYLYLRLGHARFELGQPESGLAAYDKAIQYKPEYRSRELISVNAIEALARDDLRARAEALFTRRIGRAGVAYLKRASVNHESRVVRQRAARLVKRIR